MIKFSLKKGNYLYLKQVIKVFKFSEINNKLINQL
jgi:hypothetical protein